jgi:hypothetical protein
MNNRSLIFLGSITLALIAYLYFFGLKDPGTEVLKEREKQLFQLDIATINRIEVNTVNGNLLLVRDNEKESAWMIEKPFPYPADRNLIDRLLTELEFAQRKVKLDLDQFEDLADTTKKFGLEEPRIDLKIRSDEHIYRLSIGNETTRAGNYYAQAKTGNESEWVIIDDAIENIVKVDLNAWRTRRIFSFTTPSVTSILLKEAGTEIEVLKKGGTWEISKPFSGKTEPLGVISYLGGLLSARLDSFVASDAVSLAEYGLNSPQAILEIKSGEATETLTIGKQVSDQENSTYAKVSSKDSVFTITGEFVAQIRGLLTRVREKHIVTQSLADISVIDIKAADSQWGIVKKEGVWHFTADDKWVNEVALNTFYTGLITANAVEFFEKNGENRKSLGLLDPEFRLKVNPPAFAAAGETATSSSISFSSLTNGHRYIESDEIGFILKFTAESLPIFPLDRSAWLQLKLELPEPSQWKSIAWEVPQGRLQIEKTASGVWPELWKDRKIDQNFLNRQIDLLANLEVLERVTLPNGERDIKNQDLTLVIETEQDSWRLAFNRPKAKLVLLCINNDSDAYVISERDFQLLTIFPLDQSQQN